MQLCPSETTVGDGYGLVEMLPDQPHSRLAGFAGVSAHNWCPWLSDYVC